ncbi:hypothetical protein [Verrucosispora sp. WMMD573]|uniref:hypothetical protein n=1 Tax=Verrucosispora sp. WMMD573 TaxID=3015149 RepID=UPI00248B4B64|nr:hypothetical protein [Verrucosispora sp. WMMD573]WBB51994.1 hypothetical protein O7601_15325 [Verrucosispora sp. WMMD573]
MLPAGTRPDTLDGLTAAGLPASQGPPTSVLYSPGVPVAFGPPTSVHQPRA